MVSNITDCVPCPTTLKVLTWALETPFLRPQEPEFEAGIRAFDYLVEQERWKAREIGWAAIAVTGLFLYSDGSGLGAPVLILGGGGIVIDGLSTWIRGRKILKGNL